MRKNSFLFSGWIVYIMPMTAIDGSAIPVQHTPAGTERMEARLVYMEPAVWDMLARLGAMAGKSRSESVRCACKNYLVRRSPSVKNVVGINWDESVKTSHI